jgi:hypothetical protein
VRKRKKAYLDSLLRPSSKLKDVLVSLDDEVHKLRGPLDAIRERCVHWRATSESFFQRNIELASKVMALGRERGSSGGGGPMATPTPMGTNANNNANGGSGGTTAGGMPGGSNEQGSGAADTASTASLLQLGGGTQASSKRSEHDGSHATGARSAGRKDTGLISAAASTKELHGHGHGQAHRFASSKQELELLEARCTVLRVHIQQLEQHYLNLQLAIHQGSSGVPGTGPQAPGQFQESKEQLLAGMAPPRGSGTSNGGAEFGGQFDPALVPSVPFPPAGTMGAIQSQQAALLQQAQAQQHAFALAQQMHFLQMQQQAAAHQLMQHQQQRPGTVGGAPPSGSLSARSYGGGGGGRGYTFNGAATSPLSPKPDVLSLRALRDSQAAQSHAQQQQQHQSQQPQQRLPAVPGAQPFGQQPILLATPQRPTLSFSPRPS